MERWKVKDLQQFLIYRGVPCTGYNKELVNLCKLAGDVDIEVDPDGLQEDVNVVVANKLRLDNGDCLPVPLHMKAPVTYNSCAQYQILV